MSSPDPIATTRLDSSVTPVHRRGEHDELGFELPAPVRVSKTRAVGILLFSLAVLAAAFVAGYLPRRRGAATLLREAHAAQLARPLVEVVTPRALSGDRALSLPGSVHPLEETVIYPRASGYVRRWLVDIGDHVAEGQLLAEIETPELDGQLAQARAQLAQAEAAVLQATANRDFATADLTRYQTLAPAGLASRQDLDQRSASAAVGTANVAVARATVNAARANVSRLADLRAFRMVTAPFAGTITQRMIERGALMTAGNGTPLYHLAATDPVRVLIQVPQDTAPSVHPGVPANVTVREYPGRVFHGAVARASGALDPASRTMTTEVRVPNGDAALIAGMYADVALTLEASHHALELPATALINDAHGLRIAVVGAGDVVHLTPITLERDTGSTVQIVGGLNADDRVVRVASAQLAEGTRVEVQPATTPAPAH